MNLEAPTWRKTATFNPCLFTCSGGTDPAAPLPKGRDPTPPPDLSHAAWAMEGPAGLSGVQAEQGHVPWLADMSGSGAHQPTHCPQNRARPLAQTHTTGLLANSRLARDFTLERLCKRQSAQH